MRSSGARLEQVREIFHLSREELASRIGIEPGELERIESRDVKISIDLRNTLEREFGISPRWLSTGRGNVFVGSADSDVDDAIALEVALAGGVRASAGTSEDLYVGAPLVTGETAAGPGFSLDESEFERIVWIDGAALRERRRHRIVAVEVDRANGNRMKPTVSPGDIVLIDLDDPGGEAAELEAGRIYALRSGAGEDFLIRRLVAGASGLTPVSDNAEFGLEPSWTVNPRELIIGRVVWVWKNLLES